MSLSISLQSKMKAFNRQNRLCAKCGNSLSFSQNEENSAKLICVLTDNDNKDIDESFLMSDENCIYLCELCVSNVKQKLNVNQIQNFIYSHGNKENANEQHLNWKKKITPLLSKNINHAKEKKNYEKKNSIKMPEVQKDIAHKTNRSTKRAVIMGNFKRNTQKQSTSETLSSAQKKNQYGTSEPVEKIIVNNQDVKTNFCKNNISSQINEQKKQKFPEAKQQMYFTPEANLSPEKTKVVEYRRLLQSKLRKIAKKSL